MKKYETVSVKLRFNATKNRKPAGRKQSLSGIVKYGFVNVRAMRHTWIENN